MENSRYTRTSVTYTTKEGDSTSYSTESLEFPHTFFQPSPSDYPQMQYLPALPLQLPYYPQTFHQPPGLPYQPAISGVAYPQQYLRSNDAYGSPSSTYPVEPQNQSRGSRRGSNHAPSPPSRSISSGYGHSAPSHSISSGYGPSTTDRIQSWASDAARSNTRSKTSKSGSHRTHSQRTRSVSGSFGQDEDWGQESDKESRRGGSSYYPDTDGGSEASRQVAGLEHNFEQAGVRDDSFPKPRRTRSKHTSSASEISRKSGSRSGAETSFQVVLPISRSPTPVPRNPIDS